MRVLSTTFRGPGEHLGPNGRPPRENRSRLVLRLDAQKPSTNTPQSARQAAPIRVLALISTMSSLPRVYRAVTARL